MGLIWFSKNPLKIQKNTYFFYFLTLPHYKHTEQNNRFNLMYMQFHFLILKFGRTPFI